VELFQTHVISHRKTGTSGHLLRIPMLFDFRPGQVVGLGLKDIYPPRIYSIAGSDHKTYVEFLFDERPGGLLSPKLSQLNDGDDILITKPFGTFFGNREPAWWIAGGTGVAPFKSMLDAGLYQQKTLIHGVRESDNFYFADDFSHTLGADYIRCCSGSKEDGCFYGRVTTYLEQLTELPSGVKFFLCGSAEMVVDTRDVLIAKGVAFERIVAEIYF
jgi:ferredoxin/flavodoxin---NADP+ reductase